MECENVPGRRRDVPACAFKRDGRTTPHRGVAYTTSTFLTANNLQSAVVGVTGFAPGENLQGFLGVTGSPWSITTSSGAFFNVTWSSGSESQGVAPPGITQDWEFDSGVLASAGALGAITSMASNSAGFALLYGGGNTSGPGNDVFWLKFNPAGIAVNGSLNLFRLTWSRDASASLSMLAVTNTGDGIGEEFQMSLTIPSVPAPGAVAILTLAGLIGSRRRRARRCCEQSFKPALF